MRLSEFGHNDTHQSRADLKQLAHTNRKLMSKGTVRNYTLFAYSISFLIITCSGVSVVGQINDDAPSARRDVDRSQAVPIVIGHRGACGYLPEHTTESAVLAHAMQADYIEQDVVLSKDGIPIVLHDLTLDDVTDVARVFPDRRRADEHWYAFDFTLAELRRLRIFERRSSGRPWRDKGTRFPLDTGSFRISTLAEHLQLIQGLNKSRAHQAGVYVEFKGAAEHRAEGLDLSRAILDVLTEYGYESAEDRIYLQCFDEAEVRRLRKELKTPLLIIQLLATPVDTAKLKSIAEVADGIGVPLEHVVTGQHADGTPQMTELVSNAHANALQVHVWTFRTDALPSYVGSAADYLEWLTVAAGVDGIFADQPDVVVQWRAARRQQVNGGNQFRLLNERAVPESD